jgi:type VI protein secretion system component VasF
MNTKHTPGPWTLEYDGSLVMPQEDGNHIVTAGANVAPESATRAEKWANMQLISAAPDLLKAAISCRDIADRCNNAMLPEHTQKLLKHIETTLTEAINKATNQ